MPGRRSPGKSLDRFLPERFRAAHRDHIRVFGETNVTQRTMESRASFSACGPTARSSRSRLDLADDADGHKLFTAIIRDVSDKKRLESQFLRAQRVESIGTLAGGIAHDLNNVLSILNRR